MATQRNRAEKIGAAVVSLGDGGIADRAAEGHSKEQENRNCISETIGQKLHISPPLWYY